MPFGTPKPRKTPATPDRPGRWALGTPSKWVAVDVFEVAGVLGFEGAAGEFVPVSARMKWVGLLEPAEVAP